MGKQQEWKQITYLRKVIKCGKTTEVKDPRTGKIKGGIILTDETVKPYKEKLAKLEAKIKADREQMSNVERIDDNTINICIHIFKTPLVN